MRARFSAFLALSGHERLQLGRAWIALLLADVVLRTFSLPRAQRSLNAFLSRVSPAGLPELELARLVDAAARHHVLPMRCLHRALVLQGLLAREGLLSDLRIGVRKEQGRVLAHAWLERAGIPLAESRETVSLFQPLAPVQEVL
jgi:Transglutaminase-like superfamily